VALGEALDEPHQARSVGEAGDEELAAEVHPRADRALDGGRGAEDAALPVADRAVAVGDHPGRRALEDRDLLGERLDRRDDLDRRRAGADDGHAPRGQVVLVVPRGGVEHRAGELGEALDVGDRRLAERPGGRDEDVRGVVAPLRPDPPEVPLVVPARGRDGAVQADVRPEPEVVRERADVALDLWLRRVGAAPLGVRGEGERVEVRRDVALAAGIGVGPPRAADVGVALPDHEVALALLLQADRHAEAGEARAEDADADVARCRRGPCGLGSGGGGHRVERTVVFPWT
jgi:hypothetical protein